jgi:hypothetical protein
MYTPFKYRWLRLIELFLSLRGLSSCILGSHDVGFVTPHAHCGRSITSALCDSKPFVSDAFGIQVAESNVSNAIDENVPCQVVLSTPFRRPLQQRRNTAATRKPREYWIKVENIDLELRNQWLLALSQSANDGDQHHAHHFLPPNMPPPIPNNSLLFYWKRHDLANAIQKFGRLELSSLLGGAMVIPGKWKEAVKVPLVNQVVESDPNLNMDKPPLSPQQQGKLLKDRLDNFPQNHSETERCNHRPIPRKRGFWSKQKVIELL